MTYRLNNIEWHVSNHTSSYLTGSRISTWKFQQHRGVWEAQQQPESFQVFCVSMKYTDHMDSPNSLSLSEQLSKTNSNPLAALSDSTRGIIGAVIDCNQFPWAPQLWELVSPCCPATTLKQDGEYISSNEYLTRSDNTKEDFHFLLPQRETW